MRKTQGVETFAAARYNADDVMGERRGEREGERHRECVREREREREEREIGSYWEDFQQGSSWEYCGAAAEMLGMLMLPLIMQLCETGRDHKHTNTQTRTAAPQRQTHRPEPIQKNSVSTSAPLKSHLLFI